MRALMTYEIVALFAFLFVVLAILRRSDFEPRQRRAAWKSKRQGEWARSGRGRSVATGAWRPKPDPIPFRPPDAADQLRIVMGADFSIQPLLNKSEARLFRELDTMVQSRNPGWQVMAQVSLGEILFTKAKDAFGCINSKRVDLLLVNGDCRPIAAIEYQGSGHHQGTAAARDAVKKEALRRAGIGYHEVVAGVTTPAELKRLVERLVPERLNAG
jgi:hypothetical protein